MANAVAGKVQPRVSVSEEEYVTGQGGRKQLINWTHLAGSAGKSLCNRKTTTWRADNRKKTRQNDGRGE